MKDKLDIFVYDIKHHPKLDIQKVEELYSKKDGVPVSYICTTSLTESGVASYDVFFRETPHPKFGNRYFALFWNREKQLCITNADAVEKLTFDMIEVDSMYHYSQHRHDYRSAGAAAIDGGRAYTRIIYSVPVTRAQFKIKNGKFEKNED